MPHFNIIKKSAVLKSFRTDLVRGMFDLSDESVVEKFSGSFDLPEKWNIGVIVGASGTGKSTITREIFGDFFVPQYDNNAIIENMGDHEVAKITEIFTKVGFSSPPSWLKPYHVLSNGEKMRVDLAYALLNSKEPIIFDEFTSVVDRVVAQTTSIAVSRNIRKENKKFIAVTCHFDVLDWLEPDWIFNTDTMTFTKGVRSPEKDPQSNLKFTKLTGRIGDPLESIII